MNQEELKLLSEYLSTQKLMSLATSDGKGNLWSATVYFYHDSGFNLYFMSAPDTLHSQFIAVNKRASFTICDTHQDEVSEKIGIQGAGECVHVNDETECKEIIENWNRKFTKKPAPSWESMKGNSLFYKISPKRIKFFNTSKFETRFKEVTF